MASPDIAGGNTMMVASLQSTAVAASRATLLPLGFAGLGAVMAPTDWPPTTSAYNLHEMSPPIGYASWGVVIALGLQTIQRLIQFMRGQRLDRTLPALAFCLLGALVAADYGTSPYCFTDYCFCDDPSDLVLPSVPATFADEKPELPASTTDVPVSHQDGLAR